MGLQQLKYKTIQFFFPTYAGFVKQLIKNRIVNLFNNKKDHKFLFILCSKFCGTTLMNQVICTSKSVSENNHNLTREGQQIPKVREIMFKDNRWDDSVTYDWKYIKSEWMKYWDLRKPVLLEKSPPNLLRAKNIKKAFSPSYFIISYRNPYAHYESLMRRNKMYTPKSAAEFTIKCLKHQKQNIETLDNSIVISYEEFTNNPSKLQSKISKLLPELNDIDIEKKFSAHNLFNESKMKITNLNDEKIKLIPKEEIEIINTVFEKEKEILDYFNYQIIK